MKPSQEQEAFAAMRQLAEAEQTLLRLGVAKNRQNLTGSIGEWLAVRALGGTALPVNTKDGDVLLPDGSKVEVKTIKDLRGNTSFIRDFEEKNPGNDRLLTKKMLLIVLDPATNQVVEAFELNNEVINRCKSYNSRTKSYVVSASKAATDPETVSVKEKFKWH